MHDNKFVEEDFERVFMFEQSYIQEEKERQMQEDWWEWETARMKAEKRKSAKVTVEIPKEQTNETSSNT